MLTGPAERRSVPVTRSVTIGNDPDACELVINSAGVARKHARLIPVEDGVAVRDLRTRLGTFRNGRRLLAPERLEDGDVITVGDAELRFDATSRPRPQPTADAPPDRAPGPRRRAGHPPLGVKPTREARRAALAEALRAALGDHGNAGAVPGTPSRTVLLCHDPRDRDIADLLVSYLQRRGHAVWIDRSAPGTGDGWRGRLLDVAWSSDAALFLVSPESATSERAAREVHVAGAERLPVLPVLAGPADLSPDLAWYLAQREPIDLTSGPMAGLAALAVAVEALPVRRLARPRRAAAAALLAVAAAVLVVLAMRYLRG